MREVAVRAPGRVNLIGDHTDYNDGFVLPLAIDLECRVVGTTRADASLELHWVDGADASSERIAASDFGALAARGRAPVGLDAEVASTVPIGSGLSSSAALSVSLAVALCAAADLELPVEELAQACREAETAATGVPMGIMDQLSSLAGQAGSALLIDCRTLSVDPIPLPDGLGLVVAHSGLPRVLAGSAYAERRAACEAAASRLGVAALRDATLDQVADDPRARHVVSENARVLAAADALRSGDVRTLAETMRASHASLRDDYEVSTPELDALVSALEEAGAYAARLTGAGFGGCVVAIAAAGSEREVGEAAAAAYRDRTGFEPRLYYCRAADGAGPLR
jgi:galactokinase